MIDTKDAVVRFPKGTTLLRGRLNLVLRCPEVWGLHSEFLEPQPDAVLVLLMPKSLVFSYTSLDSSKRSIKIDDGVVRTISTAQLDSCSR